MVRVIAELSANTPASSSIDRYRFRYGCGSSGSGDGGCAFTYRRPAPAPGEKMSQKQVEKTPLLTTNEGDDEYDGGERGREIIKNHLARINETNTRISMMVEIRRNMHKLHEKQQVREINEKSEKEKEKEKQEQALKQEHEEQRKKEEEEERRRKEEKEKGINHKLGKIIYKTRAGGVFHARHSIHMTVRSVYDKKTREMIETYTEKIIWNDRVFETKQDWFSEMNKLSVAEADAMMKIVRCE